MQIREELATGSFVNIENPLCRTMNWPMEALNCCNPDERYGSEPNQKPTLPVNQGRQATSSAHLQD